MPSYFLKYSSIFKTIDFNNNELPPHLFYYIHSGGKVSTDIDLKKVIPFVKDTFFGPEGNWLKSASPESLKSKILMLHDTLVEKPESGYRELMAYVIIQNPPTNVAAYLRNKYAKSDKDIEEKIKIIENYRAYTLTLAHEIILDLATDNDQDLYKELVDAFISYIYPLAKERLPEIITNDMINAVALKTKPGAKRELITLLRMQPEGKQVFEKLLEKATSYLQASQELCEEYNLRQAKEVYTQALLNADSITRNIMIDFFREYQFVPVLPNEIANEMENFFATLATKLSAAEDPFDIAAWVCMEYTRIHPKNNGNGRTSRFLANLILAQHGIVPVIFDNDEEYTQRIRAANNNIEAFTEYLYEKALESANLYIVNSTAYHQQFQHFSGSDLDTFESMKKQHKILSDLGLVSTFGMERKDYDPLEVLHQKKSTMSQNVPPLKKLFTAVEQAAKREYNEGHHYQLAKMLYQDALKLRLQAKSSNVALAVLYCNIGNCCEHLKNSVDERIENFTRAKNLIKSDPTQKGLLDQINQKLERYAAEKSAVSQAEQINQPTTRLTMHASNI